MNLLGNDTLANATTADRPHFVWSSPSSSRSLALVLDVRPSHQTDQALLSLCVFMLDSQSLPALPHCASSRSTRSRCSHVLCNRHPALSSPGLHTTRSHVTLALSPLPGLSPSPHVHATGECRTVVLHHPITSAIAKPPTSKSLPEKQARLKQEEHHTKYKEHHTTM